MLSVLKARNLIAADSNGKSDPYCRVSVGTKVFSTTVHPNTLNPEWQQSIAFINDDLAPFAICQGMFVIYCVLYCKSSCKFKRARLDQGGG